MDKKLVPDPPVVRKAPSAAEKSMYLRKVVEVPFSNGEPEPSSTARLLDTLALTCSKPVIPEDPCKPALFAIQPGVSAQDALAYVSRLLETAELNGDEISLHTNPLSERCSGHAAFVEVARRWWMLCLRGHPRLIRHCPFWTTIRLIEVALVGDVISRLDRQPHT
ncbi:hypothetical protein [Pseudomonas sp. FEN]|uniref:hypothetical protein n=1 Tax=Pseudomonas sp. FEN TaxID=2767468 RepID=UPI002966D873|nr:hypothetical protein [Pseudomonas sp. FEN]